MAITDITEISALRGFLARMRLGTYYALSEAIQMLNPVFFYIPVFDNYPVGINFDGIESVDYNGVEKFTYAQFILDAENQSYFYDDYNKVLYFCNTDETFDFVYIDFFLFLTSDITKHFYAEPTDPTSRMVTWQGRLQTGSFVQSCQDILEGRLSIVSSSLTLTNEDNYYNFLANKKTAWKDFPVDVYFFVNTMSNNVLMFSSLISGLNFNRGNITVTIKDRLSKLDSAANFSNRFAKLYPDYFNRISQDYDEWTDSGANTIDTELEGYLFPIYFGPITACDKERYFPLYYHEYDSTYPPNPNPKKFRYNHVWIDESTCEVTKCITTNLVNNNILFGSSYERIYPLGRSFADLAYGFDGIDITSDWSAATITVMDYGVATYTIPYIKVAGFTDSTNGLLREGLTISTYITAILDGGTRSYTDQQASFLISFIAKDKSYMLLTPVIRSFDWSLTVAEKPDVAESFGSVYLGSTFFFSDGTQQAFLSPTGLVYDFGSGPVEYNVMTLDSAFLPQPTVSGLTNFMNQYVVKINTNEVTFSFLGPMRKQKPEADEIEFYEYGLEGAGNRKFVNPDRLYYVLVFKDDSDKEKEFFSKCLEDSGLPVDTASVNFFNDNFYTRPSFRVPFGRSDRDFPRYIEVLEKYVSSCFSTIFTTDTGYVGLRYLNDPTDRVSSAYPVPLHTITEDDIIVDSLDSELDMIDIKTTIKIRNYYSRLFPEYFGENIPNKKLYGNIEANFDMAIAHNIVDHPTLGEINFANDIGNFRTQPRLKYTFTLAVKGYTYFLGDHIDLDLTKSGKYLGDNPVVELVIVDLQKDIYGVTITAIERNFDL